MRECLVAGAIKSSYVRGTNGAASTEQPVKPKKPDCQDNHKPARKRNKRPVNAQGLVGHVCKQLPQRRNRRSHNHRKVFQNKTENQNTGILKQKRTSTPRVKPNKNTKQSHNNIPRPRQILQLFKNIYSCQA